LRYCCLKPINSDLIDAQRLFSCLLGPNHDKILILRINGYRWRFYRSHASRGDGGHAASGIGDATR
jgi:hypothetical protein